MSLQVSIEQFSPDQLQLLQAQIFNRQQQLLQASVEQLTENQAKLETKLSLKEQELQTLQHRVDNIDLTNIDGDLQQRFNKMIRLFATRSGIPFNKGYREFKGHFNVAYHTNTTMLHENYMMKNGKCTLPEFLMATGRIEDAIRVADKMLNNPAS